MKRHLNSVIRTLLVSLLSLTWVTPPAAADNLIPLTGHVPKELQQAALVENVPPDELVQLSLVIKLDPDLMNQTLTRLYGAGASKNKSFLSSSEFALQFGLADKRQILKDFAQTNGLTLNPVQDQPESMIVHVSGPASVVEKAFSLQLNHYRGVDGRIFRAPATEPMIPVSLAPHLGAVSGLSTLTGMQHPHLQTIAVQPGGKASLSPSAITGTGQFGGLAPADIQSIYGLSQTSLNGAGQTVALFELAGYNASDIAAYEANFNLAHPTVTTVSVGGASYTCGGSGDNGCVEVSLDIEMILALASGVSQILVYEGLNPSGIFDTYNQIAMDNTAKIVSTSWGLDETQTGISTMQSESQIFQRMAAQGQTIYAATGDSGAYDDPNTPTTLSVDDPSSQPYVGAVGGTSLSGTIQSYTETAWSNSSNGSGGGGGVSSYWPLPSYQSGVKGMASQQFRNTPDVALNADPNSGYAVYVGGGWYPGKVGGTSAAAPLWAAFTALTNQQNLKDGLSVLGFANSTTLYPLAVSTSYSSVYNDVTSGNNLYYNAGPGYDNATGWGSYKGSAMINAIQQQSAAVQLQEELNTLSNVYAYPNPWDTRKESQRQVTFANLPNGATVKIFTISGFLVKTLTAANTKAVWDLTNDSSQSVASGLYLFIASNGGNHVTGKVALIR